MESKPRRTGHVKSRSTKKIKNLKVAGPYTPKLLLVWVSLFAVVGAVTLVFTKAAPTTPTFVANFGSASDFYDRFVYHVGNACDPQGCRPEDLPEWVPHDEEWAGDHNLACEGPTTLRTVHVGSHNEMFWWCAPGNDSAKGHIMTSLNTEGYGIASFSPNQTFSNVEKVCWDINSTDLGGGKWTNMVIIPASEYTRHPNTSPKRIQEGEGPYRLDYTTFGFNDDNAPGDFNVQASDMAAGNVVWGLKNFRGTLALFRGDNAFWEDGEAVVTTDKAARFKHCVTENANNTITITRARPGGTTDTFTIPNQQIPNGNVRVIFQDDNYDPPKRDGYNENNNTWHWDNIEIYDGSTPTPSPTPPPPTPSPTPTPTPPPPAPSPSPTPSPTPPPPTPSPTPPPPSPTPTPPPVDSTPPTVSITSPASGTTVGGSVAVNATAADNVAVARVELLVGGVVRVTDMAAPYNFIWNTATLNDGSYILTARAFDAAGNNTTSAPINLVVSNSVALKPGDVNGDATVDIFDLSIILANFGRTTGVTRATGDLNGDAKVDIFDLSILLGAWGS